MTNTPYFIRCVLPSLDMGGMSAYAHINEAVNVANTIKIVPSVYRSYSDALGFPSIEFHFIGTEKPVKWCFHKETKYEARRTDRGFERVMVLDFTKRDAEFERIMALFNGFNPSPLKSANDWLLEPKYKLTKIMDPDGWRHNDGVTMDTPITEDDFRQRLMQCTIQFKGTIDYEAG